MTITLTLFFSSLAGIVFMIGRKLALIRGGMLVNEEEFHPFFLDFMKIKSLTKRGVKRYGYLALVALLRFYIRSLNLIKQQYRRAVSSIREMVHRRIQKENKLEQEGREVSGFLKTISEYKTKVRNIKQKIKKEEEII